jgi:hypothetical protein
VADRVGQEVPSRLAAVTSIDLDHANLYTGRVLAMPPTVAQDRLEGFMTARTDRLYKGLRDWIRELTEARAKAKALLAVVEARGVEVPDEFRARILDCTDLDQLDIWIRRGVTADKIDDLGL